MRRFVGLAVLIIGLLHIAYVVVAMRGAMTEIIRAGVLDAVGANARREAAFWSFWFGLLLATVGYLINWITARGEPVPPLAGLALLALGLGGGLLMPVGPFWIAIPLGLLLIWPRRAPKPAS